MPLHRLDRLDNAREVIVGDLKVEGRTDPPMAKDRKSNALVRKGLYSVGRGSLFAIEKHDIGFDGGRIDVERLACMDRSGKFTCAPMVFFHKREVMVDGVVCSCGEDSDLTHPSSPHFPVAASFSNTVGSGQHHRPDGCSKAFAEADREGVCDGAEVGGIDLAFGDGVPDSCAVEVDIQAVPVGELANGLQLFFGVPSAATFVGGVFEGDNAGPRVPFVGGADGGFDEFRGDFAARSTEGSKLDAGEYRSRTSFVVEDVTEFVDDDFVAGVGEHVEAELIAHGAAGNKEASFQAEHVGHSLLEGDGGGVFGKYVVADGRLHHGFPHGLGGFGYRVAAQINHGCVIFKGLFVSV